MDIGSAGIEWPYDLDKWLRDLPDWQDHDINYRIYVVPEEEYRPLYELKIAGIKELGRRDFLVTAEQLASVRAAGQSAGGQTSGD